MEDRLAELQQLSQGNPYANVRIDEQPDPLLEEFFNTTEKIRAEVKEMRGIVIELRGDYADALNQVIPTNQHQILPDSLYFFPFTSVLIWTTLLSSPGLISYLSPVALGLCFFSRSTSARKRKVHKNLMHLSLESTP